MMVIVPVDDRGGMLFNRRRQSRDRILCGKIQEWASDKTLWMNKYSRKLFQEMSGVAVMVEEDFLRKAGSGDICFVETDSLTPYKNKIETLVLCRWNRHYPADMYLDIDVTGPEWERVKTEEFPGSSHEKITVEIYAHKNTADGDA